MRDCDWMIEKSTLVRKVYKRYSYSISRQTNRTMKLSLAEGLTSILLLLLFLHQTSARYISQHFSNVQHSFVNKNYLHNCAFWLSLTMIRLTRPCQRSRHSTLECLRGRKLTFSKIISPGWNLDWIKTPSLSTILVMTDPSRSRRLLWLQIVHWGSIFKPLEYTRRVDPP